MAICTVSIAVAFLYLGEYARKARVEGRLVDLPAAAGGSPRLEAELAVPETLLAALTVGGEVELRYPAFPHQHYGQYRGRIVRISRRPIASAAAGPAATTYLATVSLERQRVRNDRGVERDLHPGLAVQADVIVERRRLYAWLFEPFSRLRERLRA
jgi:membrane fusion protein